MRNRNSLLLAAAVAAGVLNLAPVGAELYISPAVRGTVSYTNDDRAPQDARTVTGSSQLHGDFIMDERGHSRGNVMRYGTNVPLFVAIEHVVPNLNAWTINVDEGLENRAVSWDGGDSWQDVLQAIAQQNALALVINESEKAIGFASTQELAGALAHVIPQVWRMRSGKSLIQNLAAWSERAGWHLDSSRIDFDYPIPQGAVFTGPYLQVMEQALDAFKGADQPLRARAHRGNRVIQLLKGGFKNEEVTR